MSSSRKDLRRDSSHRNGRATIGFGSSSKNGFRLTVELIDLAADPGDHAALVLIDRADRHPQSLGYFLDRLALDTRSPKCLPHGLGERASHALGRPREQPFSVLGLEQGRLFREKIGLLLKQAGFKSRTAGSADEAIARLDAERFDLVIQDMNFSRQTSGEEGLSLLARIKERHPAMPVILMTAWGSIELAASSRNGARR